MISTVHRSSSTPRLTLITAAVTIAALALGVRGDVSADSAYARADAESLQRKIDAIARLGMTARPATARGATLTPVTEREVNAYLRFHMRDQVPRGIVNPVITIMGDGRVSGRATVDLDAVSSASQSSSWLDPMRLLSGQLPVTALGTLATRDGSGQFVLESATVSGVQVPKSMLQQVVGYYSRTPEDPDGIALDEAFALPAQIREIRVQRGQAIVVQ